MRRRGTRRRAALLGAIGAIATTAAVLVVQVVAYGQDQGRFKLEGAWIARVPGPETPPQWTYVLVPDASGRSASLHGSVDVGFPGGIPHDRTTPLVGEVRQTGRDTAAFNSIWYGFHQGAIVFIGRSSGTLQFVGPDKAEVQHNFEFYLPSADVNGDGLPDTLPVASFTVTSLDTRVPPPVL